MKRVQTRGRGRNGWLAATLLIAVLALSALPSSAFQYWNDIRHSALLPDETIVVRVENPAGSGEENYLLYEGPVVQEAAMTPVTDGPSTVEAIAPGPVSSGRYYGFRLIQGSELDFMPVRIPDGATPVPEELTRVATDASGDEIFGYSNLDLVDCHVSFSGTRLYASLTNAGGGFPVASGLTFFGYLLGIADPAQADPDTVFAIMETYEQSGVISPGLYKITGTGLDDLDKLGEVTVQEFPATNTLMLSCELADLMSDPYFMSWYDPADPAVGVAGFTQRITLLGGAQEADRSPGGRCYLREFPVSQGANSLPGLSNELFMGSGAAATAQVDYLDPDGHCPVIAEIVFDGTDTYPLYPSSTDYGSAVTYTTDAGIDPLATGSWSEAVFRFSDNQTDIVEIIVPGSGVDPDEGHAGGNAMIAMISPNPFFDATEIDLHMPLAGHVTVTVYDVRGGVVRRLVDEAAASGSLNPRWNGRDDAGRRVSSGVYFVRASAVGINETRRVTLLR